MKKDRIVKIAAGVMVAVICLLLLFPEQRQQFADYVQTWAKGVINPPAKAVQAEPPEDLEILGPESDPVPDDPEILGPVADEIPQETTEVYDQVFAEERTETEQVLPADTSIPNALTDADSKSYIRSEAPEESDEEGSHLLPFISF